eukprot:COSAG06_NODE_62129_length_266_cov_0.413174_2_plen_36_part_01
MWPGGKPGAEGEWENPPPPPPPFCIVLASLAIPERE